MFEHNNESTNINNPLNNEEGPSSNTDPVSDVGAGSGIGTGNRYQKWNIPSTLYSPIPSAPWPPSPAAPSLMPVPVKKNPQKRFAVILVAVCIFVSTACGFGGTFLANNWDGLSIFPATKDSAQNTVLYQAVMQTGGDGSAGKMGIEEVVAAVGNSVVEITTETVSRNGRMGQFVSTGAGSGVIISEDGYIVTNNHVVSGANSISIRLSNGNEYKAALIGTDSKTDLAVLKIDLNDLQPAVMGYSSNLLVGQTAIAIGNPLGELGGSVTSGIISALGREITMDGETMSLLQTDTAINPGNSGGGLFNLYGELVGIINAKSSGSGIEGLGFAIPIDTAKTVIEQIITNGYVKGRLDTGLTLVDIQDTQTAMSYRTNQFGLYIAESVSDNFRSGDQITAVDGIEVRTLLEFNQEINKHSVGNQVKITVIRSSRSVTETLTLTELGG